MITLGLPDEIYPDDDQWDGNNDDGIVISSPKPRRISSFRNIFKEITEEENIYNKIY
jgi:hypothetical protein